MTEQQIKEAGDRIGSEARKVALFFDDKMKGKKWFKPIHLKRLIAGETEYSIKSKLDILVDFNLAVLKETSGESKYMLTVSNEQKLIYLSEYREYLEDSLKEVDDRIKELLSEN
jgi:hypothetical protein